MKLSIEVFLRRLPNAMGRQYYKSTKNRIYCKELDGHWWFCSKDGEPQEPIEVVIVMATNKGLQAQITFLSSNQHD